MPANHMAYLGKCYLCARENSHRLPVYVGGKVKLVCTQHGASTPVLFDAMPKDLSRRVRIRKDGVGFKISRMYKEPYGGYRTNLGGRQTYKKWSTVLAEAEAFISVK